MPRVSTIRTQASYIFGEICYIPGRHIAHFRHAVWYDRIRMIGIVRSDMAGYMRDKKTRYRQGVCVKARRNWVRDRSVEKDTLGKGRKYRKSADTARFRSSMFGSLRTSQVPRGPFDRLLRWNSSRFGSSDFRFWIGRRVGRPLCYIRFNRCFPSGRAQCPAFRRCVLLRSVLHDEHICGPRSRRLRRNGSLLWFGCSRCLRY